jgi:hypothetical protein
MRSPLKGAGVIGKAGTVGVVGGAPGCDMRAYLDEFAKDIGNGRFRIRVVATPLDEEAIDTAVHNEIPYGP